MRTLEKSRFVLTMITNKIITAEAISARANYASSVSQIVIYRKPPER